MSRLGLPEPLLHKPSGRLYVTFPGAPKKQHWLGPAGTEEAKRAYDALMHLYLAGGRRLPDKFSSAQMASLRSGEPPAAGQGATMVQIVAAFIEFQECRVGIGDLSKRGADNIAFSLAHLLRFWLERFPEDASADQFLRGVFRDFQVWMYGKEFAPSTCRQAFRLVKAAFQHAVDQGMLSGAVGSQIQTAKVIKPGRRLAHREPVQPVAEEHLTAALDFVPQIVALMAKVQWFTGARPGEVVRMRAEDIRKVSETDWRYEPRDHKTAHHGKSRTILLLGEAQDIVAARLQEVTSGFLFPPVARFPGRATANLGRYRRQSYAQALRRGAERAGVPHFAPNQIRHAFGTRMRAIVGLEKTSMLMGHSDPGVTLVYAKPDYESLARELAREAA